MQSELGHAMFYGLLRPQDYILPGQGYYNDLRGQLVGASVIRSITEPPE